MKRWREEADIMSKRPCNKCKAKNQDVIVAVAKTAIVANVARAVVVAMAGVMR